MTKRFLTATFSNGQKITRTTSNPKLAFAWHASGKVAKGPNAGTEHSNSGYASTHALASKEAARHSKWWPNDFKMEVVKVIATDPVKKVDPSKGKPWRIVESSTSGARFVGGRTHVRYASYGEANQAAEQMTATSAARHMNDNRFVACSYQAHKGPLK